MKKIILILTIQFISILYCFSQHNIGIGTVSPDSTAILELKATDKGILIPRLTSAQRNNMSPILGVSQEGLLVYDNDSTRFYYWDGYVWKALGIGAIGPQGPAGPIGPSGGPIGPTGPTGVANNQLYGVNSSHLLSICSPTYTQIPDLTKTIVLADTATLDISTTGGIHSGLYVMGATVFVSVFCNNVILPYASQYYTLNDGNWHIATISQLPPGTYTFDVRAYTNSGHCFTTGYITDSQSSLIIRVYY